MRSTEWCGKLSPPGKSIWRKATGWRASDEDDTEGHVGALKRASDEDDVEGHIGALNRKATDDDDNPQGTGTNFR